MTTASLTKEVREEIKQYDDMIRQKLQSQKRKRDNDEDAELSSASVELYKSYLKRA